MHVDVYICRDLPLGLAGIWHIKCKSRFTFAFIVTTVVKTEDIVVPLFPKHVAVKQTHFSILVFAEPLQHQPR